MSGTVPGEAQQTLVVAKAKLRSATELALGYPEARITRAEAHALLEHMDTVEARLRLLEAARDKWYATEKRLRKHLADRNYTIRDLRQGVRR